jgi:hypothetical protein
MQTALVTSLVVVGLAACDAADLMPGAGNDLGHGTRTLVLDGSAHAQARVFNARRSADFDTAFSLRLFRDNRTVTTGTVTITSSTGKITLTVADGRWTGAAPSYDQVYQVDVIIGDPPSLVDTIIDLRVDGPDIHVFSDPPAGSNVEATRPLPIHWQRSIQAEAAAVRTEMIDWIAVPDSGSYALASGSVKADRAEVRQHRLSLSRSNSVIPAGGAAGSRWTVTIENQLNIMTQPQLPLSPKY